MARPSHSTGPGKQDLRREILRRRSARPVADRVEADAARTELLVELAGQHAVIACYVSLGAEPGTRPLLDVLYRQGRRVLIPWMGAGGSLAIGWGAYDGADSMVPGPRGIPQPRIARGAEELAHASLALCPALAATVSGARLGTGGGWYDRALQYASPRAKTACLVDEDEVFAALPVDPWDVSMDLIATQTRLRGWRETPDLA